MNNKICNTKKEVPTGTTPNDKDYLTHLLSLLKDYEKNMVVALTEASNQKLYEEFFGIFDTIQKLQREAYELMFKYGWYILEASSSTKINTLYKNLKTEIDSLN